MRAARAFVGLSYLLLTVSMTASASSDRIQPSLHCIAMIAALKQPDLEALCVAAAYIYGKEGKRRDWIHGLLTRLKKSGVPREKGLAVLGTILAKLLVKCETDPVRARYVGAKVLMGAETLEEIEGFLARMRRPEGWNSADLVAIFEPRVREKEIEYQQELKHAGERREFFEAQNNSQLYKHLEWLNPGRFGLNVPPAFSARQFQIEKRFEPFEQFKRNKGLAFTLAAVLLVSQQEKLLALDSQVPFLYNETVLEEARPKSADIVSVTILPDGSPLFHVRECKTGYDLSHGIEQVRDTVEGILSKKPDAQFGSLEILVPSTELTNLHGRKYIFKAGNVSTLFSVVVRPIEQTEFKVNADDYLIPN
jgi:hypothetical protein